VTEATLNGDKEHRKSIEEHSIPIRSIAKAGKLKKISDRNIGRRVLDAINSLLLSSEGMDVKHRTIGIIGYGDIGKPLAHELRHQHPMIADLDPAKKADAFDEDFKVATKQELLKNCDVVIFAAGNMALKAEDLPLLRRDAKVAMCTSKDDEIDLSALKNGYRLAEETPENHVYVKNNDPQKRPQFDDSSKRFNLMLGGKAINFYMEGTGASIALAEGGRIAQVLEHLENRDQTRKPRGENQVVGQLNPDSEFVLFKLWREHFDASRGAQR
jgi:S-adenosylhomocysteine hydrolase